MRPWRGWSSFCFLRYPIFWKLCLFIVHNGTKQKHGIAGMEDCETCLFFFSLFFLLPVVIVKQDAASLLHLLVKSAVFTIHRSLFGIRLSENGNNFEFFVHLTFFKCEEDAGQTLLWLMWVFVVLVKCVCMFISQAVFLPLLCCNECYINTKCKADSHLWLDA